MEEYSLPVAFAAGVLSFLSPCVLPLVPVYLANLGGASTLAPQASRWHTFFHALSFVLGFSLVFTGLGASAGLIGAVASEFWLRRIAGVLLVLFGFFLLAAHRVSWLNYEMRFRKSFGSSTGYLRSILVGAVFSLAWTPCVGPVLGGILTLASSSQTAWQGVYLLLAYSLGLGIPFIAAGLALGAATPLIRWLSRNGNIISLLSGLLLIAVGILILTSTSISSLIF